MLSLLEVGARYVRVFIELCVLIGILLLLYFLAEVIEFFPPSLTLGDAAKLALVSVVAASVHFITVLANLAIAAIGSLVVLFILKWTCLLFNCAREVTDDIDWYFSKIWSTGFYQLPVLGLAMIWGAAFSLVPYFRLTSNPWVLVGCGVAFILMSMSIFAQPEVFEDKKEGKADRSEIQLSRVQVFLLGGAIAFIAPVFVWDSFDTFVIVTMTKSGLIQVPASLFLKQEFCGLVQAGFDVSSIRDGFCYIEDVAVMFHGIGDKVLVENFDNGYKVTLPADGVFLSSKD